MIPRLDEFTVKQLEILLIEVVAACRREESVKIAEYNLSQTYDDLCLWRTQILGAISTVKMRETTQAN